MSEYQTLVNLSELVNGIQIASTNADPITVAEKIGDYVGKMESLPGAESAPHVDVPSYLETASRFLQSLPDKKSKLYQAFLQKTNEFQQSIHNTLSNVYNKFYLTNLDLDVRYCKRQQKTITDLKNVPSDQKVAEIVKYMTLLKKECKIQIRQTANGFTDFPHIVNLLNNDWFTLIHATDIIIEKIYTSNDANINRRLDDLILLFNVVLKHLERSQIEFNVQ